MALVKRNLLTDIVTFSRASTATYVDATGTLVTAANDAPRYDHDPVTLAPLGLLIEPSRTNSLLRSNSIGGTSWAVVNATATANAVTAPDGTLTGTLLVENASAGGGHYATQSPSLDAATTYTLSVYVKPKERTAISLTCVSPGMTTAYPRFSLTGNGSVLETAGATSAGIAPAGGGWYRIWATITTVTGGASPTQLRMDNGSTLTYTGDGASGIYLWGGQYEAGAFPTSLIPTVASAVTRAVDTATIALAALWNNTYGTLIVQADYLGTSAAEPDTRVAVCIDDGTWNNRIFICNRNGTRNGVLVWTAGAGAMGVNGAAAGSASIKAALAIENNNAALSVGGASAVPDLTCPIPPGLTTLRLGGSPGSTYRLGGHVSMIYYPQRVTDADLALMTA